MSCPVTTASLCSSSDTALHRFVPGNTNATVAKVIGPNQGADPGVEAEVEQKTFLAFFLTRVPLNSSLLSLA